MAKLKGTPAQEMTQETVEEAPTVVKKPAFTVREVTTEVEKPSFLLKEVEHEVEIPKVVLKSVELPVQKPVYVEMEKKIQVVKPVYETVEGTVPNTLTCTPPADLKVRVITGISLGISVTNLILHVWEMCK